MRELLKADEIRIFVAYFAQDSLKALNEIVNSYKIKRVCLILGMYNEKNLSDNSRKLALSINAKWKREGVGEIRITKKWRYHGKLYFFLKNNQIFSVITGSANLSFLCARQHPQYEEAVFFDDPESLKYFSEHMNDLFDPKITENIESYFFTKNSSKNLVE